MWILDELKKSLNLAVGMKYEQRRRDPFTVKNIGTTGFYESFSIYNG